MTVDRELYDRLDEELTYSIESLRPDDPPIIIKNMGKFRKNIVTIPRGRTDLIPTGYEVSDKRILKPVEFPDPLFSLRPSQQKVYDELEDDSIINAWVSWGKTFTALSIAGKLSQKTLVVVHTVPLRNQWAREVKKLYGFEPGIIGSGKFDTSKPITIANVQSVYKRINDLRKEFGTLILDEMHHVSSRTFSEIVDSSHARYRIGLTGTLQRKDGRHVVFRDYFGNTIYKPKKENYMTPTVDIIDSNIPLMDGQFIPWPTKINKLVSDPMYLELVTALSLVYAEKGHKVLVVGDRVEFLEACADYAGDSAICVTGNIKDHDEREKVITEIRNPGKNILFGTQSIFSEGISENCLSCLILAAPLNNDPLLTQLIGRVIREHPNKLQPKIVDIHLKGKTARRQANVRTGHYLKNGYKMKKF